MFTAKMYNYFLLMSLWQHEEVKNYNMNLKIAPSFANFGNLNKLLSISETDLWGKKWWKYTTGGVCGWSRKRVCRILSSIDTQFIIETLTWSSWLMVFSMTFPKIQRLGNSFNSHNISYLQPIFYSLLKLEAHLISQNPSWLRRMSAWKLTPSLHKLSRLFYNFKQVYLLYLLMLRQHITKFHAWIY